MFLMNLFWLKENLMDNKLGKVYEKNIFGFDEKR